EAKTICLADHSKNPISSKINEIIITATKVRVAFQTIPVTSTTSGNDTTPVIIARIAPNIAVTPISNPLGCQITKDNDNTKIRIANTVMIHTHLFVYFHIYMVYG